MWQLNLNAMGNLNDFSTCSKIMFFPVIQCVWCKSNHNLLLYFFVILKIFQNRTQRMSRILGDIGRFVVILGYCKCCKYPHTHILLRFTRYGLWNYSPFSIQKPFVHFFIVSLPNGQYQIVYHLFLYNKFYVAISNA